MPNERLTFQQVLQLSKDYEFAGNEISIFHNRNFQTLSQEEHRRLDELEERFRKISRRLLNEAEGIVWDNLQQPLKDIREATDKMRKVRAHLINVNRTLTFAAAAIALGASIFTADPVAIATASLQVIDTINTFRDEDDEAAKAEADALA